MYLNSIFNTCFFCFYFVGCLFLGLHILCVKMKTSICEESVLRLNKRNCFPSYQHHYLMQKCYQEGREGGYQIPVPSLNLAQIPVPRLIFAKIPVTKSKIPLLMIICFFKKVLEFLVSLRQLAPTFPCSGLF